MTRLRYNGLNAALSGSHSNSTTTLTLAAALTHSNGTNVPTITGSDYIPLEILDSTGHLSEIVYLTAYTAGATTGTITRGREGTSGVSHSSGDKVVCASLVTDVNVGLIAYNAYAPSGLATYTITSTSAADVDATNMVVTFTAPTSGKVLIRLTALCTCTGAAVGRWSLRSGASNVTGSIYQATGSTNTETRSVSIPITGLTPGTSYTYKWAAHRSGGTNTIIYAGDDSTNAGAAVMEVHVLP